ncbi:hypothetical protein CRX72_16745 [Pantoea sp. BRM17]|nr:hypothetical protein CRX72_16745 [Pantoea sp. BRM17]
MRSAARTKTEIAGKNVNEAHDYIDKQQATRVFAKFKQLFYDKKILIVEGSGTRLGIGNDLMDGAREIKRITTLNRNAFSVYNQL